MKVIWRVDSGDAFSTEVEDAVLDATEAPRQDTSRLSCQITMRDDLDGLVLIVPAP